LQKGTGKGPEKKSIAASWKKGGKPSNEASQEAKGREET